jgi:hypothetical protein
MVLPNAALADGIDAKYQSRLVPGGAAAPVEPFFDGIDPKPT